MLTDIEILATKLAAMERDCHCMVFQWSEERGEYYEPGPNCSDCNDSGKVPLFAGVRNTCHPDPGPTAPVEGISLQYQDGEHQQLAWSAYGDPIIWTPHSKCSGRGWTASADTLGNGNFLGSTLTYCRRDEGFDVKLLFDRAISPLVSPWIWGSSLIEGILRALEGMTADSRCMDKPEIAP